jgi:hypothetical protein
MRLQAPRPSFKTVWGLANNNGVAGFQIRPLGRFVNTRRYMKRHNKFKKKEYDDK